VVTWFLKEEPLDLASLAEKKTPDDPPVATAK
jgi:hypothetical protein